MWMIAVTTMFISLWSTTFDILRLTCEAHTYLPLPFDMTPLCQRTQILQNPGNRELVTHVSALATRVDVLEATLRTSAPLRNFAHHGGGASIIPELTSQTFRLPPHSLRTRVTKWITGRDILNEDIILPIVVLEDDLRVGECWEFEGATGNVAIHLPEKVQISHVTIDYIPPTLTGAHLTGRAPRGVALWGLIDTNETTTHVLERRSPMEFSFTGRLPRTIQDFDYFILLLHAVYDITGPALRQQFETINLDMMFHTIVLEVISNWGSDTTCLYHLGIHGVSET